MFILHSGDIYICSKRFGFIFWKYNMQIIIYVINRHLCYCLNKADEFIQYDLESYVFTTQNNLMKYLLGDIRGVSVILFVIFGHIGLYEYVETYSDPQLSELTHLFGIIHCIHFTEIGVLFPQIFSQENSLLLNWHLISEMLCTDILNLCTPITIPIRSSYTVPFNNKTALTKSIVSNLSTE